MKEFNYVANLLSLMRPSLLPETLERKKENAKHLEASIQDDSDHTWLVRAKKLTDSYMTLSLKYVKKTSSGEKEQYKKEFLIAIDSVFQLRDEVLEESRKYYYYEMTKVTKTEVKQETKENVNFDVVQYQVPGCKTFFELPSLKKGESIRHNCSQTNSVKIYQKK